MRDDVKPESSRSHPRESSFISLLSGWAQQGVQSYFSTQRILLDLVMRQNASVMHMLSDRLSNPHHSPATMLTELAGEGMSNFIEAQHILLDLARQQNDIMSDGVRERVGGFAPLLAMTDLMRRSVDNMFEMHQKLLKIAGKHTHAWIESVENGKVPRGDALVELAREAMENFVHTEKQFLDVVAQEAAKATSGKHTNGNAKRIKKTELTELAHRATKSLIDAQKKLFDVAGQQMNTNLKTAAKTMNILGPMPIVPFSELTREGVKSFVEAQKAVMDVVTRHPAKTTVKARRHAKVHHAKAQVA